MSKNLQDLIEETIGKATGQPFTQVDSTGIGGGCIHAASCVIGEDGRRFFVKKNRVHLLESFKAEAYALGKMAETRTIRVPEPVGTCEDGESAVLLLEYLPMGGSAKGDWTLMGRQLAQLHRSTGEQFGWPHDNWIGSTPQYNEPSDNWAQFYADRRLRPQIDWARERGLRLARAEDLLETLDAFFTDYQPAPSLLHGDLWAGNADFLEDGTPVVFDPAAYHGDREADLALTELFGGYPHAFYRGYEEEWPLHAGYRVRRPLYLLYHVLNHFNLFGGGYGSQAESLINDVLDGEP